MHLPSYFSFCIGPVVSHPSIGNEDGLKAKPSPAGFGGTYWAWSKRYWYEYEYFKLNISVLPHLMNSFL